MKKQILYNSFTLLCLLLLACKDPNIYRVHEEFAIYVNRFENESAARGRILDITNNGLIIEFANLENKIAGLCHYETPIRIEIDRDYWNKTGQYAGTDLLREELIFHEMGHGILNRRHHNPILDNNEWKSIMCGGDTVGQRTWNINYRGFRRTYYIDELFDQNTPAPKFISPGPSISFSGYETVIADDFEYTENSRWKLGENSNGYTSIENGNLVFKSLSLSNLIILTKVEAVNVQSDFCFEFSLRLPSNKHDAKFGIAFGATETAQTNQSLDYFLINNNQEIFFGNSAWYSYFTKIEHQAVVPLVINKFKVLKQEQMLYYFLNDIYIYCTEIENLQESFHFGFIVPPLETLYADNFRIASKDFVQEPSNRQEINTVAKPGLEIVYCEIKDNITSKQ